MSGHSHWAGIKHKKGLADAKRSQAFSKLAKELTVAAKEGGADPSANPRLRTVIEKAREANMPIDNIDRAVKKATGADAGQLEEILIEAYGPGSVAFLISGITDNKNRTLGELKQILTKNKGKMVEGGAVRWLFELKGIATVDFSQAPPTDKDDLELQLIEAGAQDIRWNDQILEIYADASVLSSLSEKIASQGMLAQASLGWIPKERTTLSEADAEATERLFEALDDHDDVQDIYANL
jgi:YebC/PmpR family DNA-binding regulatory protein